MRKNYLIWGALGIATLVGAALLATTHAKAADKGGVVSRAAAERAYPTNPWTACHVGVQTGVIAGVMDPIFGVDGYSYGVAAGCDLQIGQLVIGGGSAYNWHHVTAFSTGIDAKQWDVSARAGILLNPSTLAYGKLARSTLYLDSDHTNGIGVGGGIETALHRDWRLGLEYMRTTFDDLADARAHSVTLRLGYAIPVPGLSR